MNIGQQVIKQLERFVAEGPKAVDAVLLKEGQGYIIGVSSDGAEAAIAITVRDFDRYSLTLRRLEVTQPGEAALDLAGYAAQVSARLTYLEEPLALVEIDTSEASEASDHVAILRSQPPRQTGQEIVYWEAVVHPTPQPQVSLARYRWSPQQPGREVCYHPLTFGTVGRLAEDLALSLSNQEAD